MDQQQSKAVFDEYSINVKQPGSKDKPMGSNVKWPVLTPSLEKDITEQVVNAASARG